MSFDHFYFRSEDLEDSDLSAREVKHLQDRVAPTPAMMRAFQQMEALTHDPELSLFAKKSSIVEIRDRQLLDEATISSAPVVYVGSGIDIHYPLMLGGRDILMVDPSLGRPEFQAALFQAIVDVAGGDWPEPIEDNGWRFNFNFGHGNETVRITPVSAFYGVADQDLPEGATRFVPPAEISLLMSFRSQVEGMPKFHIDSDPDALSAIKPGGYILNFPSDPSFIQEERPKFAESQDLAGLVDFMAAGWEERGYAHFPLRVRPNFLLKKAW